MKCERCGKETWTNNTIHIPNVNGSELYKVCTECNKLWNENLSKMIVKFLKEGEQMNRLEELKVVELGEKIGYKKGFEDAKKQFERPHGEWIADDWIMGSAGTHRVWCCSVCEKKSLIKPNFCPNCGASMQKEGVKK